MRMSLHPIHEFPVVDLRRDFHQFEDAARHMIRIAAEGFFTFGRRGPQGVADRAGLDELVVIHRKGEMLVAVGDHVRAIGR